jgi:hypothetical protein
MRGVVGALAMSGMRALAKDAGLIEKTPPEAIAEDDDASGVMARVPAGHRSTAVRLFHLAVGAAGGVGFGMFPDAIRHHGWAGPAWGVFLWLTYELGAAPLLGTEHARRARPVEQATLVGDHLLYGYVISETRGQPRN